MSTPSLQLEHVTRIVPTLSAAIDGRPSIEAPAGPYEWVNRTVFVGTLVPVISDGAPAGVVIEFFRVVAA